MNSHLTLVSLAAVAAFTSSVTQAGLSFDFRYDIPGGNGSLSSGTHLNVGAVYLFEDAVIVDSTPYDVKVTIEAFNNGAGLANLDESLAAGGGFQANFQPRVTGIPANSPSVRFRWDFFNGTTGTPATLLNFAISTIDVDGQPNGSIRERRTFFGAGSFTLNNPTELTATVLPGAVRIDGAPREGTDISTESSLAALIGYGDVGFVVFESGFVGTGTTSASRQSSFQGDFAIDVPEVTVVPESGTVAAGAALAGLAALALRRRRA
ncbi:MAG: hypothetical protein ACKVYV_11985 [Limisphaerales bacterium]